MVAAPMTLLIPGAGPPPTRMASLFELLSAITPSVGVASIVIQTGGPCRVRDTLGAAAPARRPGR
jgi:hypothetical protein